MTWLLAEKVHEEVGVRAYPVLAPYPIDIVAASAKLGLTAALDLQRSALDLAGRWVREKKAVAVGEVGRPHFPVPQEVAAASDEAFRHALEVARDADCPVVVHSEDLAPEGFLHFASLARETGLRPDRVVKHYARSRIPPGSSGGVVPSYLARRELVREVAHDPGPWFLETDFLDDPIESFGRERDRRAAAIASADSRSAEALWVPFVESVERVYGWRPEVGPEGAV
jgi:TatD-related deoxyribonuclease